MIVLDASVAAKWLLPEADQEHAQALLAGEAKLVAPSLIRMEVSAAIIRRLRLEQLSEPVARQACREWEQMLDAGLIHLIADNDLFAAATEFAFRTRHALQDCFYLAAAASLDVRLITADEKLAERGRKVHRDIKLLGRRHAH